MWAIFSCVMMTTMTITMTELLVVINSYQMEVSFSICQFMKHPALNSFGLLHSPQNESDTDSINCFVPLYKHLTYPDPLPVVDVVMFYKNISFIYRSNYYESTSFSLVMLF